MCPHCRPLSQLANSLVKVTVSWKKVVIDTAHITAWERGFWYPSMACQHLAAALCLQVISIHSPGLQHCSTDFIWTTLIYTCKYQRMPFEHAIWIPPSALPVQSAATVSKYNNSTFQIPFLSSCLFINACQETIEKGNFCIIYHSDKIHHALEKRSLTLHSSSKITPFFTLICQKT